MKELRIDRDRALRVAAMIGLAVLAVSILPGLLSPPPPAPVPDGVGFSPGETAAAPTVITPADARRHDPQQRHRSKRAAAGRSGKRAAARRGHDRPASARDRAPATAASMPSVPVPNPSVPVAPSPALPLPPQPAPVATADGSQEFAPH